MALIARTVMVARADPEKSHPAVPDPVPPPLRPAPVAPGANVRAGLAPVTHG